MDNVKVAKCLDSILKRLDDITINDEDVAYMEAKDVYFGKKSLAEVKYTKDSLCKLAKMNMSLVRLWNDIHDLKSALIKFDL